LFRHGVVDTVSFEPNFDVVGESSNGEDALALIGNKHPQVVIIDINLPGMNGLQNY